MSAAPERDRACLLSIVVPAYDESERLPESLDTIRAYLDSAPWAEVIVVDDGSTDGTAEVVRRHSPQWPQLRLVSLPRHRQREGSGRTHRFRGEPG